MRSRQALPTRVLMALAAVALAVVACGNGMPPATPVLTDAPTAAPASHDPGTPAPETPAGT